MSAMLSQDEKKGKGRGGTLCCPLLWLLLPPPSFFFLFEALYRPTGSKIVYPPMFRPAGSLARREGGSSLLLYYKKKPVQKCAPYVVSLGVLHGRPCPSSILLLGQHPCLPPLNTVPPYGRYDWMPHRQVLVLHIRSRFTRVDPFEQSRQRCRLPIQKDM